MRLSYQKLVTATRLLEVAIYAKLFSPKFDINYKVNCINNIETTLHKTDGNREIGSGTKTSFERQEQISQNIPHPDYCASVSTAQ